MMTPPMVGVPDLTEWLFGPSSLTTCPTLRRLSERMMDGATAIDTASAIPAAAIDL